MAQATNEQVNKRYAELEDWRAARIMTLVENFKAGIITQAEFLHDVRQAMLG